MGADADNAEPRERDAVPAKLRVPENFNCRNAAAATALLVRHRPAGASHQPCRGNTAAVARRSNPTSSRGR
eukprot:3464647-Alexandrium_andersonii.AAC.1